MQVNEYVKPELLVVAVMLYFTDAWMKRTELISDKYIPAINGMIGIVICAIYVAVTCAFHSGQEIL